jgi:hypothetical protein
MCRRVEASLPLDEFAHIQEVSLLFAQLPWSSAVLLTMWPDNTVDLMAIKEVSGCDSNFPLYFTGTEYFKATWDQAIVDVLSEKICRNTWFYQCDMIDRSSEKALDDIMCVHGNLAEHCMNYLYHQRIFGDLGYANNSVTPYAERYWAKHLMFSSIQCYGLLEMCEEFATKWHMLNLDDADAHLVVQWLKVS